ncbi:MAG: sodium:proton antiporter [Oscillospiraceae bacterium]|nr:sodium:proton antiporter [Oscillospiraceae bacterium]
MLAACFVLFFAMVAAALLSGLSVAWALLGGLILFWLLGLRQGFSSRALWEMAWNKCRKSLIVVTVIALIGVITGLWRLSGTIAYCIVRGVELVTPRLFLVVGFLLCAALSYVLGTSYGVSSTMGVILMALARSGGVDPTVTAGVILSGVYFGDRCSPASSAASLVAAVTETDLYRNVRQMLRTGLLPTLLTLALYTLLSFRHPITGLDEAVLSALTEHFSMSWLSLLPAVVMFVLPLCKVPIKLAMGASIAAAAVLAVAVQGFSLGDLVRCAWSGYHPQDGELAAVLSGGGVTSMASSYVIVLLTGLYSGILEGTGSLRPLSGRAEALAERIGRFPAMIAVSVICAAVLCNQAVTSMMGEQLLGRVYTSREELAMDIENSGIMLAGLIPWSIACSIPLAMLGADARALPCAALLWLTPVCYWLTKRHFYPVSQTGEEG